MKILVLSDLHLAHLSFSALHEGRRIDEHADVVDIKQFILDLAKREWMKSGGVPRER
jgi:hypothetical protein